METADAVDFKPQGFEDGIAEWTEPGTLEDVFGKRTAALTFSSKVGLTSGSDPGAMHRCGSDRGQEKAAVCPRCLL